MECANTEALNSYMDKIEKAELAEWYLSMDVEPFLSVISEQVEAIKALYKLYGIDYDKSVIEDYL